MRSKIAKRILDETPADVRIFVRKHADIVVRVHQLLREKGWTQKDLSAHLEKAPSEISNWLNGDHNFTLRSLSKLEAELGAEIIYVAKRDAFHVQRGGSLKSNTSKSEPISTKIVFQSISKPMVKIANKPSVKENEPFAA
jgi:transcriptional regulator with XRE-family HTH domain